MISMRPWQPLNQTLRSMDFQLKKFVAEEDLWIKLKTKSRICATLPPRPLILSIRFSPSLKSGSQLTITVVNITEAPVSRRLFDRLRTPELSG
jgi:hypothetical protein